MNEAETVCSPGRLILLYIRSLIDITNDPATPANPVLFLLDEITAQRHSPDRTGHGADGRLWCAAVADPAGHASVARHPWEAVRHRPLQCQRMPCIRAQRHRDSKPDDQHHRAHASPSRHELIKQSEPAVEACRPHIERTYGRPTIDHPRRDHMAARRSDHRAEHAREASTCARSGPDSEEYRKRQPSDGQRADPRDSRHVRAKTREVAGAGSPPPARVTRDRFP